MSKQHNEFYKKYLRLKTGNPFRKKQADLDDLLHEYFVPTNAFYRILDYPSIEIRSAILSARRGQGKTAHRRMVELCYLEQKISLQAEEVKLPRNLIVTYSQFDEVIAKASDNVRDIRLPDHLDKILRLAIQELLNHWAKCDELIESRLSDEDKLLLGLLLKEYSSFGDEIGEARQNKLKNDKEHKCLTKLTASFAKSLIEFYAKSESQLKLSNRDCLDIFVNLLPSLDFENIVVLIDRIDESELTGSDFEAAAELIAPLLTDLTLLEKQGFAIKFFIPEEVRKYLVSRKSIRFGERIPAYSVRWSNDELINLASKRLEYSSGAQITDLGQYADLKTGNVSSRLAEAAKGSPRNMFRLCELVLLNFEDEHKKNRNITSINERMIDASLQTFVEEESWYLKAETKENYTREHQLTYKFSILKHGKVSFKNKEFLLNLSKNMMVLLNLFVEHPHEILGKEQLLLEIYPNEIEFVSDERLTKLVQRLRKELKRVDNSHKFIVTKRGIGYYFNGTPL